MAAVASRDPANNPVRKKALKKLLGLTAAVVIVSVMFGWVYDCETNLFNYMLLSDRYPLF
jgi:hypothetical protein